MQSTVAIIGGGLSGLCCAIELQQQGIDFVLYERSEKLGGRVQTDLHNGYQLDHGFEVLQTAYPEARRLLDYNALQLKPFRPGAVLLTASGKTTMADPWRDPIEAWNVFTNGIGTYADRWKLFRLRQHVCSRNWQPLEHDLSTHEYLTTRWKFSPQFITQFLRPWFAGVFFESSLNTSARYFEFVFRMFALGDCSLPADGMGAIPAQLASRLPPENLHLSAEVTTFQLHSDGSVSLQGAFGEHQARNVVFAMPGQALNQLLKHTDLPQQIQTDQPAKASLATACLYYGVNSSESFSPMLILNTTGQGIINHCAPLSEVARNYAPDECQLMSVNVIGDAAMKPEGELVDEVGQQLKTLFGSQVAEWTFLKCYQIAHALPEQRPDQVMTGQSHRQLVENLWHCGDECLSGSIHGAMLSGSETARAIATTLQQQPA